MNCFIYQFEEDEFDDSHVEGLPAGGDDIGSDLSDAESTQDETEVEATEEDEEEEEEEESGESVATSVEREVCACVYMLCVYVVCMYMLCVCVCVYACMFMWLCVMCQRVSLVKFVSRRMRERSPWCWRAMEVRVRTMRMWGRGCMTPTVRRRRLTKMKKMGREKKMNLTWNMIMMMMTMKTQTTSMLICRGDGVSLCVYISKWYSSHHYKGEV